MEVIQLTKYGNILLPVYMEFEDVKEEIKKVIGYPVNINSNGKKVGYGLNYSLEVHTKNTMPTFINGEGIAVAKKIMKVLVSPFDIVGATKSALNVSRYKVVDDIIDISNIKNGIVEIENEELFEMPYDIFKSFIKKNRQKCDS
jgi:hypothetical protein